jgi:hypothetical protein
MLRRISLGKSVAHLDLRLVLPVDGLDQRGGMLGAFERVGCVFRAKSAVDSGTKSATDSDVISAIPI